MRVAVKGNLQITILELLEVVQNNFDKVQSINTEDMGMRPVSTKIGPKLLLIDQEDIRASVAQDLNCVENDKKLF